MMFEDAVNAAYKESKSVLSIGLDVMPETMPPRYSLTDCFLRLIDETYKDTLAYKANLSGYLAKGEDLEALKTLCKAVQDKGRIFIIDPKANDVDHTAREYAKKYFEDINADACTVNVIPFLNDTMDSFTPYLGRKGVFVLNYTTGPNSEMFWNNATIGGLPLWKFVSLKVANDWSQKPPKGDYSPVGIVAGPRNKELATEIRSICDTQPILVPGLGPQGVQVVNLKYLRKRGAYFPGIFGNVGRDIIADWKKHAGEDPFTYLKAKAAEWKGNINEVLV